jgi:hypothetical protein
MTTNNNNNNNIAIDEMDAHLHPLALKELLKTGGNHAQMLMQCAACECCDIHKQRRPAELTDLSFVGPCSGAEKEGCCECPCRHSGRCVVKMYHNPSYEEEIRDLLRKIPDLGEQVKLKISGEWAQVTCVHEDYSVDVKKADGSEEEVSEFEWESQVPEASSATI